ncbi:MAG TPA: HupE/UreJ family protein, partial [Polyangiales bacterium]|nr:HupE/UreJ family protein [Polyangiales bacterium]
QLAGTIHAGHNEIPIARHGSFWRGLRSVVSLGMEHIATGSDHLMFLFALVLVAPVAAVSGSWSRRRTLREAGLTLAGTVTAFTLGHSLTLALGALGWVALPSTWVELAIAGTVLVTAVHALKPIFPGRELLLTAAFGLVHGLAFAGTLMGRDLGRSQALWTLVGFNTGIELAQLGLLFIVVPWVLLLARTRAYAGFRVLAASSAVLLALGWLFERATGQVSPTAAALAWLEAHPMPLLAALALGALLARLWDRAGAQSTSVART